MKINEAAHAYNITSKELLTELKAKFPGQKFTANTELPEGFECTVQEQSEEYAAALDIVLPKTSGEVVRTGKTEIVTVEQKEAIEYGISEAIRLTRLEDFALEGSITAIEDIQEYQRNYNATWSLFQSDELAKQQTRSQALNTRLDAIATQKGDVSKQVGKFAVVEASVRHGKKVLRDRLTELLG